MLPDVERLPVIGIGADGWAGLDTQRQQRIYEAEVIVGGRRHLAMLPASVEAERHEWPSPLRPNVRDFLDRHHRVAVLASGDPMFFGIGSTLVELLGRDAVEILPGISSQSLACARMGWPIQDSVVVSAVARDPRRVIEHLAPDRKLLVLSEDARTPEHIAALLVEAGYGASRLTVFSDLGAPAEACVSGLAQAWHQPVASDLNIVAIECSSDSASSVVVAGDDAFDHDGQLTKRDVRASALARLAPQPGELLWDVGAGAGSVAIEWMRAHPDCRAIAVESHPQRVERISQNASAHGVPNLSVVQGRAPDALADLDPPDAVFIGGGATTPGLLSACWNALRSGGRLVAHGVTLETEALLVSQYLDRGGELVRLCIEPADTLGTFTAWKPTRAIIQWSITKTNAHQERP